MNHLFRELAPISDAAWAEIDGEATRTLTHFLAARKLVDFEGPLGYDHVGRQPRSTRAARESAVDGRHRHPPPGAAPGRAAPPFTLDRAELDSIDRGACDADLDPVVDAAGRWPGPRTRSCSTATRAGGIAGIGGRRRTPRSRSTDDFTRYPNHVAKAVARLKAAGIGGPYAIALGPRCYAGVIETTEKGGYPLLQHLGLILGGPVVWAPAVDGAIVLSQRGGDFELTVGQDVSIGYRTHDADTVTLELQESVTFVAPYARGGDRPALPRLSRAARVHDGPGDGSPPTHYVDGPCM